MSVGSTSPNEDQTQPCLCRRSSSCSGVWPSVGSSTGRPWSGSNPNDRSDHRPSGQTPLIKKFLYQQRFRPNIARDLLLPRWIATTQDGKKAEERAIFTLVYWRERERWKILRSHKSLQRSFPQSETSKARPRLSKFCRGNGIDLGYGGDPIVPSVITMDMPIPYTKVGDHPQNLAGDARDLYWFKDNVLDYVYSSHLLQDFSPEEMVSVIREWLRVIKIGGLFVLYSPDEQAYRAYCTKSGQAPNASHKIANFGLKYMKGVLEQNFRGQYSMTTAVFQRILPMKHAVEKIKEDLTPLGRHLKAPLRALGGAQR